MSKPIRASASVIFLALLCAGILAFTGRADVTKATYTSVNTIVGVDAITTGNTATSLGNIDRCVSVSPNATFNIDLFIMDVTELNDWQGVFTYDQSKLEVIAIDVDLFLKKNPASGTVWEIFDCSVPGSCLLGGADQASTPYAPDTGSGVLGRLTVKAKAGASGTSRAYLGQLKPLSFVTLAEPGSTPIGDLNSDGYFDGLAFNAIVAVDVPCPADADADGFTNVEESIDGSDLLDAASTPEMCDDADDDLDNLTDEWYDRNPVNGVPDCGEGSNPGDPDDDNDGFTDEQEAYLATDSLAACRANSYHSAWPLDVNNDGVVTVVGDVLNYRGLIGAAYGDGAFRKRLDLNGDGVITVVGDVLALRGHIGEACS